MARPPQRTRRDEIVERVCVALVLAAIAALVLWIVLHAGGGVLNQG